ncbi:MAG: hypothetical protein ISR01_04490 [Chitinophagales bacterium]|jgi:hypothetical protein|nr:hypothetical protein [Chitinophagales bacterium]|tara:strand:- start:276 stop:701 length:426 start_codon:yes stop_codon:yes gene_type:complete
MDFQQYNNLFAEKFLSTNQSSKEDGLVKAHQVVQSDINFEEEMSLVKANKDLIDLCLVTKSDKYISREELLSYGLLALNLAAIDAVNEDGFRVFARRRIELTLNKAIAEAYLLNEIKGKRYDNSEIGLAFDSIEKTYGYNY